MKKDIIRVIACMVGIILAWNMVVTSYAEKEELPDLRPAENQTFLNNNGDREIIERVLGDFFDSKLELMKKIDSNKLDEATYKGDLGKLINNTVSILREEEIEAYILNSETERALQEKLLTSFDGFELDEGNSYFIILTGGNSIRSTPTGSFEYYYNGTTYVCRYLTVTAADASFMAKTGSANILHSSSVTVIQNCLDAIIDISLNALGLLLLKLSP